MSDLSHESLDCKVFRNADAAFQYGKGGIFYEFADRLLLGIATEKCRCHLFPQEVKSVHIIMPVRWSEIEADIEDDAYVQIGWATDHPLNNHKPHKWKLSGTYERPTLSPSLNWIGKWHGWLRDGRLESC